MARPVLVIESGLFQGSKYFIYAPFRIGRHPDNDLQLTDKNISRFHAIIEPRKEGFIIRDLGSRNGTFVNGQRVKEAWLTTGDQLVVGSTRMRFAEESASVGVEKKKTGSVILTGEHTGRVRARSLVTQQWSWKTEFVDPSILGQLARLQVVYQTNILLSSQEEMDSLFKAVLQELMKALKAQRAAVLIPEVRSKKLEIKYSMSKGKRYDTKDFVLSQNLIKQVFEENTGLLIEDTWGQSGGDSGDSTAMKTGEPAKSVLCVPVVDKDQTVGLLYFETLRELHSFSEQDLQMVTAVAAPLGVQIRNIQIREQIEQAYVDTLSVLANAIEARDHYTVGHTWRVTKLALAMVQRMGCTQEQYRWTQMGGILHDIGKIAIEDSILRKPGPLSPEEYQKMQLHPEHGARILKDVEFLKPVIPYVLFHQERWDGKGYPFGLNGDEIPWEGRLLAVCDAFDAMTSHRPYRRVMEAQEAFDQIWMNRGKQFDPEMVDIFRDIWEKGEVGKIMQDGAKGRDAALCPFCSTYVPLGDRPKQGIFVECPVCNRTLVICKDEFGWKAELA